MTSMTETGGVEYVTTMCTECGATRQVKRRAARSVFLRCAVCNAMKEHEPFIGDDYRERLNRQADAKIAERERLIRRMIEFDIEVNVIAVRYAEAVPVEVRRYEGGDYDGLWWVELSEKLSLDDQISRLKWAWTTILTQPMDGDLCHDEAGLTYRGFYWSNTK
jgi:hypothetical protein